MGSDDAGQQAEPQAMTAERLAVIRAMIALTDVGDAQFEAITELLADNERPRAREAALVDTEDWQMPAWRRYERWQEAHAALYEALYEALGGVRMGAYRPDGGKARAAVIEMLLWTLLVFDNATR